MMKDGSILLLSLIRRLAVAHYVYTLFRLDILIHPQKACIIMLDLIW
jgi:hypothetical protein